MLCLWKASVHFGHCLLSHVTLQPLEVRCPHVHHASLQALAGGEGNLTFYALSLHRNGTKASLAERQQM